MFSLEQLPETVRLDVDVHMVALHPERAVTRSPLQNTVVGTGWRTLDARKALRKEPRVVKTVSSDSYFAGHTASLLFQRSISARHRKKMTPDPRLATVIDIIIVRAGPTPESTGDQSIWVSGPLHIMSFDHGSEASTCPESLMLWPF